MIRGAMVRLINLIDWEVADIDVRLKAGFEWGSDAAERVPVDAAEEVVGLDLGGAVRAARGTQAVGSRAEQAFVRVM